MRGRGFMVRGAALVLTAVLAIGACQGPGLDEGAARRAAMAFLANSAAPGETIGEIRVDGARQETRGTTIGWVVEVEGVANAPDGTVRAMILFIDGVTGTVTIDAQG